MKKRVGFGYLTSLVLPGVALAVLMLRVFHPYSRWVALLLYAAGWVLFVLAVRRHPRVRSRISRGTASLGVLWKERRRALLTGAALVGVGATGVILMPIDRVVFLGASTELIAATVRDDLREAERVLGGFDAQMPPLSERLRGADATDARRKPELRAAWASYLDRAVALDQLIQRHPQRRLDG